MKRKEFNLKQQAIIDASTILFMEKGYDSTSIDDILKKLKISRGTFYHYFKTKIDLLDAIILNVVGEFSAKMETIMSQPKLTAIQKLNDYYSLSHQSKLGKSEIQIETLKVWVSNKNALFRSRLISQLRVNMVPSLQKIITQGVNEKSVEVINIHETANLIFDLGVLLRSQIIKEMIQNELQIQQIQTIVDTYELCIENFLVLPKGSMNIFEASYLKFTENIGDK
jgi:AcrR family transcriptional regulator